MTWRSLSSTTVKAKQSLVTKLSNRFADRADALRLASLPSSSNHKCCLYKQRQAEQTCQGRRPWHRVLWVAEQFI